MTKNPSPSSPMDSIASIHRPTPTHRTIAHVRIVPLHAPPAPQSTITLPQRQLWHHIQNTFKTSLVLLILLAAGTLFYLSRTHHLFTITSGSMEPSIRTGSVAAVPHQSTNTSYTPGDIITFTSSRGLITHRIIEEVTDRGATAYRTQGDANPLPDHDPVPASNIIGKVNHAIPYLGFISVWLKTKLGFALIILLPATFVILQELRAMRLAWQELRPRSFSIAPASLVAVPLLLLIAPFAHALLTATATLNNNSVSTAAVFPSPSPTPSPTDDPSPTPEASPSPTPETSPTPSPSPDIAGDCDLDVEANLSNTNTGPGSTNENTVDINHDCTITETNETTINNSIDITANTGGNTQSGNTNTGSQSTGNITIDLGISNQ